jgi:hypothetical protein
VLLEDPEKEWWAVTEMGLFRTYMFDWNVTTSDGSVGTDNMGAAFVWVDHSKCGREEEGASSGRAEMGADASILRRTPDC